MVQTARVQFDESRPEHTSDVLVTQEYAGVRVDVVGDSIC